MKKLKFVKNAEMFCGISVNLHNRSHDAIRHISNPAITSTHLSSLIQNIS